MAYKAKLLLTCFLGWMTRYEGAKKQLQDGYQVELVVGRLVLNFNREKQLNI